MMPFEDSEETRKYVKRNPCPDWFWNLQNGLFWKEIEENFARNMVAFAQEKPENYLDDAFAYKIKELSRLERYQ